MDKVFSKINNLKLPPYFIAEAGVNHNGNIKIAYKMIEVAAEAGADAIKFQTFIASDLVSSLADKAKYQKINTDKNESQLEMLKKLELKKKEFLLLKSYAKKYKIDFLSTPFEEKSLNFLLRLRIPAIKIPSGEINNFPFLTKIAKSGKPVILSTGMANLGEVESAIEFLEKSKNKNIVILHCVSQYPSKIEDTNLLAMITMQKAFGYPVGMSDHSEGIEVPIAATALGARCIEKHFTLDKNLEGPDHKASVTPVELKKLILSINKAYSALGDGIKKRKKSEHNTAEVARKSIVAKIFIPKGTVIRKKMLTIKRPGNGIRPKNIDFILGRTAKDDIKENQCILLNMLL